MHGHSKCYIHQLFRNISMSINPEYLYLNTICRFCIPIPINIIFVQKQKPPQGDKSLPLIALHSTVRPHSMTPLTQSQSPISHAVIY